MFLQSKIQPAAGGDAMQQKMLQYGLPLMFGVMGLYFPSGLGVYMLTNSALSIAHSMYMKRTDKKAPPKAVVAEKTEKAEKSEKADKADKAEPKVSKNSAETAADASADADDEGDDKGDDKPTSSSSGGGQAQGQKRNKQRRGKRR
jgi:hypothetical protein